MNFEYELDFAGQRRLEEYFDQIGAILRDGHARESFAMYAMGLLGEGERKSVEPIAARACGDPEKTDAVHQRLLHFVGNSPWSDRAVRREAARYAVALLGERDPVRSWVVDDTGWLKQGKHSVGVQRQYTGSAGKIANSQIGVSLSVTTSTQQLPIDFELYLPESWTSDPKRRKAARIPDEVSFQTKHQLALAMIDRALADGIPRGMVLADAAYGNSSEFREQVRQRGLDYAVAVEGSTKIWTLSPTEKRQCDPISIADLGFALAPLRRGFRRTTWREGTKEQLSARFAFRRVLPFHDDGWDPDTEREPVWLVIEWPDDEAEPCKYHFIASNEKRSRKQMIRRLKERWRTERAYEDLKGELGLDHYEGRGFRGWHHHVSVALCCYAFLVAERARHFPPWARRQENRDPLSVAA